MSLSSFSNKKFSRRKL